MKPFGMLLLMREAIDGDKMLGAILSILGPSPSILMALVGPSACKIAFTSSGVM